MYFQGNPPSLGLDVFDNDNDVTVYYSPGTTGWDTTFGGPPTMAWENGPPAVTLQPQSQTVNVGGNAAFIAAANGTPPFSYQWLFNSAAIVGATGNRYGINQVQAPDAGDYSVIFSNSAGSATSDVAVLTVGGAQFNALNLPPMTLVGAAGDSSRNTYVLGLFTNTINIAGKSLVSQGGTDYVLAQYRPDGTVGWAVSFGSTQDEAGGSTLAVVSNGVFVTGTTLAGIEIVDTAATPFIRLTRVGRMASCFAFPSPAWQSGRPPLQARRPGMPEVPSHPMPQETSIGSGFSMPAALRKGEPH